MEFFKLNLADAPRCYAYYDQNNQLKFVPAVYEQRYGRILYILDLWEGSLKKVVEFGCAELKFVPMLKKVEGVEHIIAVDIDRPLLETNKIRVNPLHCEYLLKRECPLKVDVFEGSIDAPNDVLNNTDVVIAIEVIEHLYPDVLENMPYNIFGFIQPKLALFTTPNSDFNVLFDLTLPNGMRHLDHKFEWTRSQFRDWCQNICQRFPKYVVSVSGIGNGPPEQRHLGKVSQLAVFIRKDMVNLPIPIEIDFSNLNLKPNEVISLAPKEYNLVHSVEFPVYVDDRTLDEKLIDEAKYQLSRFHSYTSYKKIIDGVEKLVIPIKDIFAYTKEISNSMEELRNILKKYGYSIESDHVVEECYDDIYGDDMNEILYGPDGCNQAYDGTNNHEMMETEDKDPIAEDNISEISECWD